MKLPLAALLLLCTTSFSFAQNNPLKSAWESGGKFGGSIGCAIRSVSNLEKVSLTDTETGTLLKDNPAPIQLSAAKGEYEGFQLVLTPMNNFASDVKISVSRLKSSAGYIPASEVTVNAIGYIRTDDGKLNPDPLLAGKIPSLAANENQPVWITVHVPRYMKSGIYTGTVSISASGRAAVKIPLSMKVRTFEIPKKISLRSSFWLFRDQINRFYHLDEVKLDDYLKWVDLALEHRLCPIDVYEGRCQQLLNIVSKNGDSGTLPNLKPDFTKWDKYIDRMVAGGASTIHLGQSHHLGTYFTDKNHPISSPTQVSRVVDILKVLRDHYKKRGVYNLHYMQLRDETSAPDSLNVYRDVQSQLPDVKLLLTAPSGDARPYLSIPCPLTPSFDNGWRDEVKNKGGEYWWYVCCGPDANWANLFIPQQAVQHRVLFWQTWQHGVDGILYWGLNYWAAYDHEWPANVKYPQDRIQPTGNSAYKLMPPFPPGDGFSMYPGPTPSQPLSSIRLENMRDGEEDYEYFILLDKLIASGEKNGVSISKLEAARSARQAALALIPGMLDYSRNSADYLKVRELVGDAIENLSQKQ